MIGEQPTDAIEAIRRTLARAARSPKIFIVEILTDLADLKFSGSPSAFEDFIRGPYDQLRLTARIDPDAWYANVVSLQAACRVETNKRKKMELNVAVVELMYKTAAAHCACAERCLDAGQEHLAWTHLMDAQALRATLITTLAIGLNGPKLASAVGKAGAPNRHRENRASKVQALAWLDQHRTKFRSLEDAADAIAGKIVPMSRSTVRGWLTGYDLHTGQRHGVSAAGST